MSGIEDTWVEFSLTFIITSWRCSEIGFLDEYIAEKDVFFCWHTIIDI